MLFSRPARPARSAVTPALTLAVHKLRSGWRGWAALAALIAIAGGAVLAAIAGAIRTDTAYPRFLAATKAGNVLVSPANSGMGGYYDAISRLRQAAVTDPVIGLSVVPLLPDGKPVGAITMAVTDDWYAHPLEVPRMLAGRLPSPRSPGEIAVNLKAARQLHVTVGSVMPLGAMSDQNPPAIRKLTGHVVGIFLERGSIVPVNQLDNVPRILASIALWRQLGPAYRSFDGANVLLKQGESVADYTKEAQHLAGTFHTATGGQVYVADETIQAAAVERAIRPQAIALTLFALALALTALLVVGQVAVRLVGAAATDNPALAALGMTRRQLWAASLAETAAAVGAGTAGAVVIAVAASPLTPIGPARLAEPSPGISVNVPVLAAGGAAIALLMLGRVAVTAWRRASVRPAGVSAVAAPSPASRRSRLADRLAAAGAPLAAVTGLRFAFGDGPGRVAGLRSALIGLGVAVASVAAAATFGANLVRLADTPRLYGQDWQASLDLQFGTLTPAEFDRLTARVPGIAGVTFGVHGIVSIRGTVISAIGLAPGHGPVTSSDILAGRPPRTSREIVLGTSVLRDLGLRVGQTVTVTASGEPISMRITGSAVFPYFGQGSFTATDAGQGAETTAVPLLAQANAVNGTGYNFALVRFTAGPAEQAGVAAFRRALDTYCQNVQQSTCVVTDQRPNTVNNYAAIDGTPAVLAGILAVLGGGVLAQFLLASARRRRHDFAVLKVLGMARSQLRAVAFWQVAVVTAVTLAVGLPLGVAAGRWAWRLFTGQVGLPGDAITPLPVLWMIPVTFALAALIALPPARSVARVPAADTLRSE
jgi:ABC-type antimicrobial peptide transport system permease subunit